MKYLNLTLIFIFILNVLNAANYSFKSIYNSTDRTHTEYVIEGSSCKFQIDNTNTDYYADWKVTDENDNVVYQKNQDEAKSILGIKYDPKIEITISGYRRVQAQIRHDGDYALKETHIWYVYITNTAPTITRKSPSSPVTEKTNRNISFTATSRDDDGAGDLDKIRWYIDGYYKDGTDWSNNLFNPRNNTFTHSFESPGNYTVKAVVYDQSGATAQTSWSANVVGTSNASITNVQFDKSLVIKNKETITATITIKNTGNIASTFYVGSSCITGAGPWLNFVPERKSITLESQSSGSLTLSWTPSLDATDGDYEFYTKVFKASSGTDYYTDKSIPNAFVVKSNIPDSAKIVDFIVPTGTIQRGSTQQIEVKIRNTGTTTRSFWIGLSLAHETATADDWPNGWYDIVPQETKILVPEDEATVTFSFIVPEYWRSGQYYAVAAIWEDFNPETYLMVEPRYDYLLWHESQYDNPDIGKKTFALSKVTFNDIYKSNFVVGNIIREILQKSTNDIYTNGVKPFLRMNFIEGSVPIIEIPFFGGIEYGSASCGMIIDLADYLSITPEGQDGYTTIWIDLEMNGANINIENPVSVPVTLFFEDIDLKANGELDQKEDELKFLTGQFLGVAFTGFTWDGEHLSGPQAKIGGTISGNKLINFSVEESSNILLKAEIKTELLDHMFTNAVFSSNNEFINSSVFLYNFYNQFKSYLENPELFKKFTFDDGDWKLTNGVSQNGLHMELLPEQIENSANWFFIDVPENCKKLVIKTYGGSGELAIFHKYNIRPTLQGNLVFDNKAFEDNSTNQELTIENPKAGKHYIALRVQSEGFYKDVNLIANYELGNGTKIFTISPDNFWDYGNVTVNYNNDKTFLLQNTGSSDLIISNINIDGTNSDQFEILSPTSTNFNIAAKASVEIKVRFKPTFSGSKSAQLEILNNSDNASPAYLVSLNGTGTEVLTKTLATSSEDSWDYGNVTVDDSTDKTFLLQNSGSSALNISNVNISGTDSDQFEILSPTSTNFNIAAKSSAEVKVRFSPTSLGAKSAQLKIANNSDNASPTKTIFLWGTGTDVLTKTLVINPENSWDYGNVTIDVSSDKTFLLQNTGSANLNISDVRISGTNSDQFEIVSPMSTNFDIASKSSAEVKIRFSPTSSEGKSAQLEISNNSDNTSPIQIISLYGNGISEDSIPTGVIQEREQEDIKIYPNPTSGIIKLKGLPRNIETIFSVFNMQGQLIFKKVVATSQTDIDISTQKPGIYLLIINNDWTKTYKIVKSTTLK